MKYKDRDELVSGLRELADFIEEKGLLLPMTYPSITLIEYVYGEYSPEHKEVPGSAAAKMGRIARIIRPVEKNWTNYSLTLRRHFGKYVKLDFTSQRKSVCVPNVVGTEVIPEQVIPARTVEVIEWDCTESLLKAGE